MTDEYFDMYFWGNGKELSDKGTTLSLISAGKAASGYRARVVVDAIEPVTLTADYDTNVLYVFADANIAGYDAGLAYKRSGKAGLEDALNTVGVWGKAGIDMFTLQADLGATFLRRMKMLKATTTRALLSVTVRRLLPRLPMKSLSMPSTRVSRQALTTQVGP